MIDPARILARYPASLPRYTSYPTAPQFRPDAAPQALGEMLAAIEAAPAISLYMHLPYCDRLCWFCGCHTRQTLQYSPVARYAGTLEKEIALLGENLRRRPRISHLHFGGGSPSMLKPAEFRRLAGALGETFGFAPGAEISVEIDPGDATDATYEGLEWLGVTRASIGVQDFDPAVQLAINRPQTFRQTESVVRALRAMGIGSINIDMLYGLPLQTFPRLLSTASQVLELKPDRIALFGYAHVPWIKKHQNLIREADLPGSFERFEHAGAAGREFARSGYARIGIDHFALPGDNLAKARAEGRLRRNFQGYTADNCEVLVGLGASAIGRYPGGYIQNLAATGRYEAEIGQGRLAAGRAYRLNGDDKIRAWIIGKLMCDFGFGFDALQAEFGSSGGGYLDLAVEVAGSDTDGLCMVEDGRFAIPEAARPFARMVAAKFDAFLANGAFRYSKAV